MYQLLEYYGKWHGFKGRFTSMPAWARLVVGIVALPGLALTLLSILAIVVSLIALFIPANLAYRLVSWMTRGHPPDVERTQSPGDTQFVAEQQGGGFTPADDDVDYDREARPEASVVTIDPDARPRRQIEVKIVE